MSGSASTSGRGGPGSVPKDGAGAFFLAAALALGLLRFLRLSHWSLWLDEVYTWADAHEPLEAGRLANPLGYAAIRATVALLGGFPGELELRALPALVGWLTIPLAYWAARPFAGARRAGLAALLVAVSAWHVYWSQNARFYTLAQAAGLIGAGLVWRGLLGGGAARVAGGALIAALGVLFHPSAALLLGALVASALCVPHLARGTPRELRRGARILGGLALVAGLAGAVWMLGAFATYLQAKGIHGGAARLSSLGHLALTLGFYVTPLWCVGFLLGALQIARRREPFAVGVVLAVVAGVATAALAALVVRVTAQYVFVLLPLVALVVAWPVGSPEDEGAQGGARMRGLALGYAALLSIVSLADTGLYFAVRHGERPRWREAFHFVWSQRDEHDLVFALAAPIAEHYLVPGATDLRSPTCVAWLNKWNPTPPQRWLEYPRRVWLVIQQENLEDFARADRDDLRAYLREECRLVRRFPVPAIGRDQSVEVYLRE